MVDFFDNAKIRRKSSYLQAVYILLVKIYFIAIFVSENVFIFVFSVMICNKKLINRI
jgi:hypothetical protein